MKEVSTAEFKSKLSQYLAEVREGEALYVTSHGYPVAEVKGVTSACGLGIQDPTRPVSDLNSLRIIKREPLQAEDLLAEDRNRR
jgi:prevent-host-death family protein